MPTPLPRPRRVKTKAKSVVTLVFNTFMVVSALLLTFAVLVREEQYALAQPDVLSAMERSIGGGEPPRNP